MKYVTTRFVRLVQKALLYLRESNYSKETLKNYFKDEEWFDDEYIESEKRKKNKWGYKTERVPTSFCHALNLLVLAAPIELPYNYNTLFYEKTFPKSL